MVKLSMLPLLVLVLLLLPLRLKVCSRPITITSEYPEEGVEGNLDEYAGDLGDIGDCFLVGDIGENLLDIAGEGTDLLFRASAFAPLRNNLNFEAALSLSRSSFIDESVDELHRDRKTFTSSR